MGHDDDYVRLASAWEPASRGCPEQGHEWAYDGRDETRERLADRLGRVGLRCGYLAGVRGIFPSAIAACHANVAMKMADSFNASSLMRSG
jgi:hypothetical protein